MSHINVYVESFTEHIPARMLPVSSFEDIRAALVQVQETDDLYRDGMGNLTVDAEWHAAAVLDFGEWLLTHMPSCSESIMCYNFSDFPIMRDWMRYNASERAEEVGELVNELWEDEPPTGDELAQAHIVADMLLRYGRDMTINVMSDIRGLESIYVPAFNSPLEIEQMAAAGMEELAGMSESDSAYWAFLSELTVFCLACVKSDVAVLSYALHSDGGNEAVGMFLFAEGHVSNMPRQYFPAILDAKTSDEQILADNMASIAPRDQFELDCSRLSAAIMFALHAALTATYEHNMKHSVNAAVPGEEDMQINLSLVDSQGIVLGHNLLGEYAALVAPFPSDFDNLTDMFDAALEVSPFVEESEATRFVVSACIASGACEVLLTGAVDDVTEEVCDLVQAMDFGLADIALDFDAAQVLIDHAELVESYKELDMSEEVFEELPEEQRSEVFQLVDTIQLDASAMKTIVSMEGDIGVDDEESYYGLPKGPVKATALRMPSVRSVPEESANEMSRLLKQMCIQAFQSPSTTMFVSSRGEHPNQVSLSAVQWRNGHWEDLGEDKTMTYLMSSNIGSQLDILPGDDVEYRGFRS